MDIRLRRMLLRFQGIGRRCVGTTRPGSAAYAVEQIVNGKTVVIAMSQPAIFVRPNAPAGLASVPQQARWTCNMASATRAPALFRR